MCQIQTHYKGDIMEYILKNGIVYDPANEVNGEKMDVIRYVQRWCYCRQCFCRC